MRIRALFATAALAIIAAVGIASPASAHDAFVGSDPASGSEVAQMPDTITLTFTANVLDDTFEGRLSDGDGNVYPLGAASFEGPEVTVEIPEAVYPASDYRLDWKVASSDGHPIASTEGSTTLPPVLFTVTEGSVPSAPTTPSAEPRETATVTASAEPSASPSATPSVEGGDVPLLPLVIGALALVAVGVVIALAVVRRRR